MPLIIAHRGASFHAPENTFAAFRKAIDAGADGIELDVRISKDSVPVVVHDPTLKRLAGVEKRVSDLTAAELEKLDVGSWFNRKFPRRAAADFSNETIPTLTNFFDFLGDYRGLIYVELKCENDALDALIENVCETIRRANILPNVIIKSFNLEAIRAVKKILPEAKTAALFEPKILTVLQKKKLILAEAKRFDADQISIHRSLATKKFVRASLAENLPVVVWTADNPIWVKRALDYKIGAIITNDPARLLVEREKILQKIAD